MINSHPFADNMNRQTHSHQATGLVPHLTRQLSALLLVTALVLSGHSWLKITPIQAATVTVLAVVNGKPVTSLDLAMRRDFVIATTGLTYDESSRQQIDSDVMQMLIDDQLKIEEGLRLAPDAEQAARNKAAMLVDSSFGQDGQDPDKILRSLGIQRGVAEEKFFADVLWASAVQGRYSRQFLAVDQEAEAELERLRATVRKPHAELEEIVLVPEPRRDYTATLALAGKMVEAIRNGADFGRIAQQYSAAGSSANSGKLGWVLLERLPDETRQAIKDLKAGEIADIQEIDGAIVIYRIGGIRRDGKPDPLEAEIDLFRLMLPLANDADNAARLQAAARISKDSSNAADCTAMEELAKIYGGDRHIRISDKRLLDLPAQLRQVIQPLAPGETTAPLNFSEGVAVFMLCDRSKPQMNLPPIETIRETINNRHFSVLSARYLTQLRRNAVITYPGGS